MLKMMNQTKSSKTLTNIFATRILSTLKWDFSGSTETKTKKKKNFLTFNDSWKLLVNLKSCSFLFLKMQMIYFYYILWEIISIFKTHQTTIRLNK